MKNFRKTIIALATVAAMLVPSAAMAATLTTTVDKDITGDVYVGFYDGAILKDVVKTTVDAITVDDATPAGTEDLPVTVTITDESTGQEAADAPGQEVRKIVFTAKGAGATFRSFNMTISYDNTKIATIAPGDLTDMSFDWWDDTDETCRPYTVCNAPYLNAKGQTKYMDLDPVETKYVTVEDRDVLCLTQQGSNDFLLDDGVVLTEIYYRTLDGATAAAEGTFSIETEIGEGTLQDALQADPGKENGIKISNPAGGYTYGCWLSGVATPDTIKLVTPWDVQESTTKDLTVTVPAGAEGYTPTMFIWDADQIAQCAPITTFTKN